MTIVERSVIVNLCGSPNKTWEVQLQLKPVLPFKVSVDHSEGFTFLKVQGEADGCAKPVLKKHLATIESTQHGMVVDLKATTYIEGCCLALIAWAADQARRLGKVFRLIVGHETQIHRVLDMVHFHKIVHIEYEKVDKN